MIRIRYIMEYIYQKDFRAVSQDFCQIGAKRRRDRSAFARSDVGSWRPGDGTLPALQGANFIHPSNDIWVGLADNGKAHCGFGCSRLSQSALKGRKEWIEIEVGG
jgi:hypothetical protein